MAPLFLEGDEAKVLRLLLKVAGKPATMRRRDFDVWEWRVIGKFSYFEEFGELYYDGDICFKLGKDWNVQILGKRLK